MDRGAVPVALVPRPGRYEPGALPFLTRRLPDGANVAISTSGDHAFLSDDELRLLTTGPAALSLDLQASLQSRFFLRTSQSIGQARLLASRLAERRKVVDQGPSLHIFVPTLQCAHTCQYCQVSRALGGDGFTMSESDLLAACRSVFESSAPALTVEFQGGDPLVRFDLVRQTIEELARRQHADKRPLRFVVATTLHQLDEEMCAFFRDHQVFMSTSLDGPRELHNRNRPLPTRDSYERTLRGIELARTRVGEHSVSALATITRLSLQHPEAIVDHYVELGFNEVFLRPLSMYGFAKKNEGLLGYSQAEFFAFYERGFERVLHWNRQGHAIREVTACVWLNKMLSPFDAGYVDLQTPTGAGTGVLVYHYDGYVYPSDEARMLAAMGDVSLRLGRIGQTLAELRNSQLQCHLIEASTSEAVPGCRDCAYRAFCGRDPVNAYAEYQDFYTPVQLTSHCNKSMWMFDFLYSRLRAGDDWFTELAHAWAQPPLGEATGA